MEFPKMNKNNEDLLSKEEKTLGRSKLVYVNLLALLSFLVTFLPHFATAGVNAVSESSMKAISAGKMNDVQQLIRTASQQFAGFDTTHAQHESHYSHESHESHSSHYSHYSSDSSIPQ